jgi:type II secretory pathway pseudopilin PulG
MSLEMIVALIAASASIACAIISIFASRDAQKAAARAQEASRRMEQLRLQATKVGQELIDTLTDMIFASEKVLGYFKRTEGEPISEKGAAEFWKLIEPINELVIKLRKLLYTSAIYITPEISQNIETVLGLTMKDGIGLSAKGWEQFIGKLQKEH